ncbi:MAG: hypothetical protein RIT81_15695 [Deltaproteobacteria bacterium]
MNEHRVTRLALLCVLASACGEPAEDGTTLTPPVEAPAPNAVTGSLDGFAIDVKSAAFIVAEAQVPGDLLVLMMSSEEDVCGQLHRREVSAQIFEPDLNVTDGRLLVWWMLGLDDDGEWSPVVPGEIPYGVLPFEGPSPVPPPPGPQYGFPMMVRTDAACDKTTVAPAFDTSAAMLTLETFTATTGGTAKGSFFATKGGDRIEGVFEAEFCEIVEAVPEEPACP